MAQISRAYKHEVPILIRIFYRNYNKRRQAYTHYEVLRISPNATQKEIRDAYIKLSKEMHPDSDKGNHAEFVKLNQAYSILSRSESRHSYDINLRYQENTSHSSGRPQEYDFDFPPKQKPSKEQRARAIRFCAFTIFCGLVLHVTIVKRWYDYNRRKSLERSSKIQKEYLKTKEKASATTLDDHIKRCEDWNRNNNLPPNGK